MLRLERIEIVGFKSFPEKTKVEFPEGVTAVVGPNGCGKSNVVDAVQWALGEQSARALRGARMEDVIFAGSKDRGPGGLAEVTLHLHDTGEAPRRVSMTRRLYRTGESEYLLDGRKARLTDIRALLDEIRAGVRTYAIIDQSRVGSFVISKPKERRVFIEEAAGISSYKQRRRQAELKLEATRANLLRVEDILREVERQRRSLQRQASLARRARRLDEEYFGLKEVWLARRWSELTRRVRDLRERLGVAQREAGHLEAERRRLEEALETAKLEAAEAQRDADASVHEHHESRLALERIEHERETALQRAETLDEEARRQGDETERLASDRRSREDESRDLEARLAELASALEGLDTELAAARERVDAERKAYREAREEASRLERELYARLHERADLSARLSAAREAAEREARRAEESQEAGERLSRALDDAREARTEAERHLAEAGEAADAKTVEVAREREREEQAHHALEEARGHDAAVAAELGARAAERAAIDSLEVRLAGADGSRALLEHAKAGRLAADRVIADVIHADPDFEQAAEAFLEDLLPAVLVPSAGEVVRGAELGVRGRLRFLPLDAPHGQPSPGAPTLPDELVRDARVYGRLSDRLKVDRDLNGSLNRALGEVLLVDALATALELREKYPSWSFLTPEGHAVRATGLVTVEGGGDGDGKGLLARARRREELAEQVAQLESQRDEARESLAAARDRLAATQASRRRAEEELGECRQAVATARMAHEQASREVTRLERELVRAGEAHETSERGLAEARQRTAELESQLDALRTAVEEKEATLEAARARVAEREEALEASSHALAEQETERRAREERVAAARRDAARLERELRELSERSARGADVQRRAREEAERLRVRAAELADQHREAEARVEQLGERVRLGGEVVTRTAAAVRTVEDRLSLVARELEAARVRREHGAVEVERSSGELAHVRSTCTEELERDPDTLSTEPREGLDADVLASDARLSSRLAELRQKRSRIGPVNLLAEKEFEELTERWTELTAQEEDLRTSVEELEGSIKKMNRESRERFLEAFTEIRRHFREQFAVLFRGGRADLVLEDESDPLESGIEIICQPPGKKLQSVSLLSGGEKALAATAVLFAIFRYHPPPFCLLDEVDAPLDDANVGRFADVLRGFAERTQFIMITHNKRTMELADLLYGVTMPEPGVSRLVSMTLD
jgi:chromosome segregation protein